MPLDTPREPLSLADRLRLVDQVLETAPGRIRLHPIRRSLWRWLLMPANIVVALAALLASPQAEALRRLPASLSALDAIALRVVARACRGDVRAARLIFDWIEGRPARRRGDARYSPYVQGKRTTGTHADPGRSP
jgi:hypothetical protein